MDRKMTSTEARLAFIVTAIEDTGALEFSQDNLLSITKACARRMKKDTLSACENMIADIKSKRK